MKQIQIFLCILFIGTSNLVSQEIPDNAPLTIDSGYINVKGGRLYYEAAGSGPCIILLHDGMVDHQIWDEQFPLLAKNYKVVRYDRRTYGKSSDSEINYSNVDDLNQVMIELKIDKAVIFGMSSGGGLAIDFTLKYPEKVIGLVLIGAVVSGYGYSSHMSTRGGRIDKTFYSNTQKLFDYFIEEDPYEIYRANVHAQEKLTKIFGENPKVRPANGYVSRLPERPALKFLSEIKVPTLVLVGEYDIPDVHAHSGVINAGIENSKKEIIANSGHLIPIEQPGLFNELIISFLSNLSNY
jgi:pimeloyl-ACP methyl ester carboxylesterase